MIAFQLNKIRHIAKNTISITYDYYKYNIYGRGRHYGDFTV